MVAMAVDWAISFRWGECIIESDCHKLVYAIVAPSWISANLVEDIGTRLLQLLSLYFTYVRREGNRTVNWVAFLLVRFV